MRPPRILGVDPGSRTTGLCVITADGTVIEHDLVENTAEQRFPAPRAYLKATLMRAHDLVLEHDPEVLAIETIRRPNWHMKGRAAADPSDLLATAQVLGAIQSHHWPRCKVASIAPRRNGSRPMGLYPPALVTDGERRKPGWEARCNGSSLLRHIRSAYDVAIAGREYLIQEP